MVEGQSLSSGNPLVERAKKILLSPKEEWPKIAAEPDTPNGIFMRYAVPLAAIGPVATFIGSQVFGYGVLGISYRPGLVSALGTAILSYVFSLIGLVVLALIADFLAPKFGGTSDRTAAFKLVAYSYTAGWIAGIFGLVPALAILGLLGLYSFYLFYLGATPVMKVPEDKAAGYTGVTILSAIVLYLIVGAVTASVMGLFGAGSSMATADDVSGELTVPGLGTIDIDKIEEAGKQMESAASGKTPAVAPAVMQGLLPDSVGSYARTAVETTAMGPMGSQAAGTYTAGEKSFSLTVSDMSAMGALAGLGTAMGIEQSREDGDGYERTGTVDGQMRTERWSKGSESGNYSVVVNNRFMIAAEGSANSIDELKAAVAAVDQGALARLTR